MVRNSNLQTPAGRSLRNTSGRPTNNQQGRRHLIDSSDSEDDNAQRDQASSGSNGTGTITAIGVPSKPRDSRLFNFYSTHAGASTKSESLLKLEISRSVGVETDSIRYINTFDLQLKSGGIRVSFRVPSDKEDLVIRKIEGSPFLTKFAKIQNQSFVFYPLTPWQCFRLSAMALLTSNPNLIPANTPCTTLLKEFGVIRQSYHHVATNDKLDEMCTQEINSKYSELANGR